MPKVEPLLVACGAVFLIECAIREDYTSPASEFLEDLQNGNVQTSAITAADNTDLQPDEQIDNYAWFMEAFRHIAETGRPLRARGQHNQLRDSVWEFKRYTVRITFFDTDGSGCDDPYINYDPASPYGREWPDDFYGCLRLATGFIKTTQQTLETEINRALHVRKEDLRHDRS